jgi:hypothetical protein
MSETWTRGTANPYTVTVVDSVTGRPVSDVYVFVYLTGAQGGSYTDAQGKKTYYARDDQLPVHEWYAGRKEGYIERHEYTDIPSIIQLEPVAPPPVYADHYLTVNSSPINGGTTDPSGTSGPYAYATNIVCYAYPDTHNGFVFDHWNCIGQNLDERAKWNPVTVVMTVDITLTAVFTKGQPIPPEGKGTLEVNCLEDSTEVAADVNIASVGNYITPFTLDLDPGNYDLTITYKGVTKTDTVTIESGSTTKATYRYTTEPPIPPPDNTTLKVAGAIAAVIVGSALIIKGVSK